MKTDDQFVAVVLVLVGARFDWEVGEGSGDPRQEEVDHGPQLLQSVLEGVADEENSLLAGKCTDMSDLEPVLFFQALRKIL